MPTQSSPPWMRGSSFGRRVGFGGPDWRVSDAERAEVTDRLARHLGEVVWIRRSTTSGSSRP